MSQIGRPMRIPTSLGYPAVDKRVTVEQLMSAYANAVKRETNENSVRQQLSLDFFSDMLGGGGGPPSGMSREALALERSFEGAVRHAAAQLAHLWSSESSPSGALPPPTPERGRPQRTLGFSLDPMGFPPGAVRTSSGTVLVPDLAMKQRGEPTAGSEPVVVVQPRGRVSPSVVVVRQAPPKLWQRRAPDGTRMTLRVGPVADAKGGTAIRPVLHLANGNEKVVLTELGSSKRPRIHLVVDDRRDLSEVARAVDAELGMILDYRLRPPRGTAAWAVALTHELWHELGQLRLQPYVEQCARQFLCHGHKNAPSTPDALLPFPAMMGRLAARTSSLVDIAAGLARLQALCTKTAALRHAAHATHTGARNA